MTPVSPSCIAARHLASQTKTLKLYHGTKPENAEAIIRSGFDLKKIHAQWTNDYAISTLTTPRAVLAYFGKNPGVVLEMTFRGNLFTYEEIGHPLVSSPQGYTRMLLEQGIDAVALNGSPRQVFVYNTKSLSNIHSWTPPTTV